MACWVNRSHYREYRSIASGINGCGHNCIAQRNTYKLLATIVCAFWALFFFWALCCVVLRHENEVYRFFNICTEYFWAVFEVTCFTTPLNTVPHGHFILSVCRLRMQAFPSTLLLYAPILRLGYWNWRTSRNVYILFALFTLMTLNFRVNEDIIGLKNLLR